MRVKGEEGAQAKTQGIIMNVDKPLRKGKVRATDAECARHTELCPENCLPALACANCTPGSREVLVAL